VGLSTNCLSLRGAGGASIAVMHHLPDNGGSTSRLHPPPGQLGFVNLHVQLYETPWPVYAGAVLPESML
jgi:hypothetical protein